MPEIKTRAAGRTGGRSPSVPSGLASAIKAGKFDSGSAREFQRFLGDITQREIANVVTAESLGRLQKERNAIHLDFSWG